MLPWKSIISINSDSKRAIYLQIADTIISEIIQGRISPGAKLPGSRNLSGLIGFNRKTILLSFDELVAQGWIEIIPYKGAFVKKNLPISKPKRLIKEEYSPSEATQKQINHKPKQITDGVPDYRVSPTEMLYKTARSLTKGNLRKTVLTGNHFYGEESLRRSLVKYLNETRALKPTIDNLMITRGSQMSIFLSLSSIIKANDVVLVGELNYALANETITYLGGKPQKVSLNHKGLDIHSIEEIVRKQNIKAIYISPHHQYPTTVTMPIEDRLKLLELAIAFDFYIIEDDYDYDYHYSGSPILPIASLDQGNRVIYIGSFSKIFAPSIRMGYMFAHAGLVDECVKIRKLIDRRGDPVLEKALSILIEEKEIHRSIKKAVNLYKTRRDIFCTMLKEKLGNLISFQVPEGGMAVWVTFQDISVKRLIEECAIRGLHLDVDTYSKNNACRLGFASMNPKEMEQNVDIMKMTIESMIIKSVFRK